MSSGLGSDFGWSAGSRLRFGGASRFESLNNSPDRGGWNVECLTDVYMCMFAFVHADDFITLSLSESHDMKVVEAMYA
jgi:hypothetical protein